MACGGDKEEKPDANSTPVTGDVADSSSETNESGLGEAVGTETESSDKNQVGSDKVVTEGTATKNDENIYNVGGIELELPDGSKRQHVFVGAGLTFEVKTLQGMIRCFYIDDLEGNFVVEDVPAFVDGYNDRSFENGFVANYLDKFERTDDELLDVAGFKARKVTYKGTSNGDCYRDGPVKNLVDATLETVCIYNDVDSRLVVVCSLCKSGKAADMDKALMAALSTAESKPTASTIGLYGDRYAEIGGFSFEVPDIYGKLVDCRYENFSESYTNYYGAKTRLSESLGMGISFALDMAMYADDPMFGGFGGFVGFGGGPDSEGGAEGLGALAGMLPDDFSGFDGETPADLGGLGGMLGGFGGFGGFGGAAEDFTKNLFAEDDTNWLNVMATRQVYTKEEFAKAVDGLKTNVPDIMANLLSECSCTQNEKITVDGMEGIRFSFTGMIGETPTACKILLLNNIKDRYVVVFTSFYDAEASDLSSAYEELAGSLKLVK